jgi:nitroreductase
MIESTEQKIVDAAITSRRSVRAFLPTPIGQDDIEAILKVASRAPSGTNTQPWKVYVLTGATKERLSAEILKAYDDPEISRRHTEEYHYYPLQWVSPYIDRRRKLGWDLYSLLKINRDNKAGMHAQLGRNYKFFDASVGMIFTIDRLMEQGSWLDYGTFLQNVMIAARGRGLDTCPQQAFTQYHKIIAEVLQLPPNEMVVCGMSLGYADQTKIENSLVVEREPLSSFVKFFP